MWIKICGNTNLDDAARATELGADAVGFVFAASKRRVTAAQVAAITPFLPEQVERVGVFDSHDSDEIARIVSTAGLTTVQLHGGLDEKLLEDLGRTFSGAIRIVQTIHWDVEGIGSPVHVATELKRAAAAGVADRILIDSKVGASGGGNGVAFDWTRAREVFASAPDGICLILAGGLKPGNTAQAIESLNPWGVDVCSGVEASLGRKDPELMARFIKIAHSVTTA